MAYFSPDAEDCVLSQKACSAVISLPEPGEYGQLVVHRQKLGTQKIFGKSGLMPGYVVTSVFRQNGEELTLVGSDDPQERSVCWNAAQQCFGDVLVVGVSVGVMQGFLGASSKVTSVLSVGAFDDVVGLIKPLYKEQRFVVADSFQLARELSVLGAFDCVYIHPWSSFHFELLPYLNFLVSKAEKAVRPGGRVLVWGYKHSVDLYVKECLLLLKKAIRKPSVLGLSDSKLDELIRTRPMYAACLEFLRSRYVRTVVGGYKWAPKREELADIARQTALSARPT